MFQLLADVFCFMDLFSFVNLGLLILGIVLLLSGILGGKTCI